MIGVVVPVYNRLDLTKAFLSQIPEGTWSCVFDNGSTDGTLSWLEDSGRFHLSRPDSNIHQMWNEGWNLARAVGCETIVFANNDVTFQSPNPLTVFEEAFAAPEVAQAGICVLGPVVDGTMPGCGLTTHISGSTEIVLVEHVPGCLMAVRADMPLRFDEGFHWWFGETDLYRTILKNGGRLGIARGVKVDHMVSGSMDPSDAKCRRLAKLTKADEERFRQKWLTPQP